MSFTTDKQTLDDLNLTGKYKPHSVFSFFNQVQTAGGERLLEALFKAPLTHHETINEVSQVFRYFQHKQWVFPFNKNVITAAVAYLALPGQLSQPLALADLLRKKWQKALVHGQAYDEAVTGLQAAVTLLQGVYQFMQQLNDFPQPDTLAPLRTLLQNKRMQWIQEPLSRPLTLTRMARYQYLLLQVFRNQMEALLDRVYYWDVCIAVSAVARENGLYYAHALPAAAHVFSCTGLRHPSLPKGVANPLVFSTRENLLFLTGANMAGKSTLMKATGIALYLAHMGFPVAARDMRFSVLDGLYTSINVPDSLQQGYSHFYAEVLRVKKVAEAVSSGLNLMVIFDELFKGTNVKDAYDATLAVTEELAAYRNCFFIISTHIIEVGEALRNKAAAVNFAYLPTVMQGATPRYTYQLTAGITNDRQGMLIIQNEGIPGLLRTEK